MPCSVDPVKEAAIRLWMHDGGCGREACFDDARFIDADERAGFLERGAVVYVTRPEVGDRVRPLLGADDEIGTVVEHSHLSDMLVVVLWDGGSSISRPAPVPWFGRLAPASSPEDGEA